MFRKLTVALGLATATMAFGAPAQALLFDQNVTPDVIFGTGNSNGFWTVDRNNNVEVGLRGKIRYQGVYNSQGNGTYTFDTGSSNVPPSSAALWNYEFAINVNLNGSPGGRTLADVDIVLSIDTDPGLGQSWISFNPFAAWTDNAVGDNSTGNGGGVDGTDIGVWGPLSVAQNSQNLGWTLGALSIPFDYDLAATYDFRLAVFDPGLIGQVENPVPLALTEMTVEVGGGAIPEPSSLALLGAGLAGLVYVRRRNRRASSI